MASIIIPAEFRVGNKRVRVRALLDTGAEVTGLVKKKARQIRVPDLGPMPIQGVGGAAVVRVGRVDEVRLPQASLCKAGPIFIWVFDPRTIGPGLAGIDAVIGLDFVQKSRMEIRAFTRRSIVRCKLKL